jgi:hypothetical protein
LGLCPARHTPGPRTIRLVDPTDDDSPGFSVPLAAHDIGARWAHRRLFAGLVFLDAPGGCDRLALVAWPATDAARPLPPLRLQPDREHKRPLPGVWNGVCAECAWNVAMAKRTKTPHLPELKPFDGEQTWSVRWLVKWADLRERWAYPELARISDRSTRRQVQELVQKRMVRSVRIWGAILLFAAAITQGYRLVDLLTWIMQKLWTPADPQQAILRTAIAGAAMMVCSLGPALLLLCYCTRQYRRALRFAMVDVGLPICTQCGYDLTGNLSGVCPECGTAMAARQGAAATAGQNRQD